MKQKNTLSLAIALWGAVALWGCEKTMPAEPSPAPVQANQQLPAPGPTEKLSPAQLAWMRFVDKVERGEQIDPTGQYVKKGTIVAVDESGHRIKRPKHDAAKGFIPGLVIRASGTVVLPGTANREDQPHDPIVVCDGTVDCPGGGGPPAAYTIFVSSESTSTTTPSSNPNGYIYDLKIVKDHSGTEAPLSGYQKINLDLNRGAGGEYIYLTFTRDPDRVQLGDESGWGWSQSQISGPVRQVSAFTNPTGISIGWTFGQYPQQGFVPVWAPNPIPGSTWKHPDLNDGSGGSWIYAYQFKDPALFHANPIEVGVIASNYDYPLPPPGWIPDYSQDLNQGAGGDYIYFCYKDK